MSEILIGEEYQAEQERMHREHDDYGVACLGYVDTIANIVIGHDIQSMLDYGAGKGRLVPALSKTLQSNGHTGSLAVELYDPGVPEWNMRPSPAELVTCIDVLEHVEPQYTLSVLHDLERVTDKICLITIGLKPARKVLSDGRNAHINLRPANEWIRLLLQHFRFGYAVDKGHTLIFSGTRK
jgi:hypothetical protein